LVVCMWIQWTLFDSHSVLGTVSWYLLRLDVSNEIDIFIQNKQWFKIYGCICCLYIYIYIYIYFHVCNSVRSNSKYDDLCK
jgi:hypothetical protein